MNSRKENMELLKSFSTGLVVSEKEPCVKELRTGSWLCRRLYGSLLVNDVQVFEATYSGVDGFSDEHIHEDSTEVFNIINGTIEDLSGNKYFKGQTITVLPGERHSLRLSSDGKVIIVVFPPEHSYN